MPLVQLCTFEAGGRMFGVDILHVREICAQYKITPIHHARGEILGYMGLRGQIHLVVDLSRLFGFAAKSAVDAGKVVIFKPTIGEPFGIRVDRIADVVAADSASIDDRRRRSGEGDTDKRKTERRRSADGLALGVCRMEKHLLVVLEPMAILPYLVGGTSAAIPQN